MKPGTILTTSPRVPVPMVVSESDTDGAAGELLLSATSLSGAISGGTTPQYTATGTPSYGGAMGTGLLSLNSRAISGGATPLYMATGTQSYGGEMGTIGGTVQQYCHTGGGTPSRKAV